jgi:putative flippase GtrA
MNNHICYSIVKFFMNKSGAEIMKFSVVGMLNTGIDMAVFAVLIMFGVPVIPAQCVSYACGIGNSYILNRYWTFRQKGKQSIKQPIKFICVNLVTLVVVSLILNGMHNYLNQSLIVSKVTATLIGVFINFMGSRYWVFQASFNRTS